MTQIYYHKNSDELYHHGILGMKWGVRRYQNADGTLTEAGKKRLNKYKSNEYTKLNKLRAKSLAANEQDTINQVKKRQSPITNTLDPSHERNDKAIESNNKFAINAERAYSNINSSLKNLTYKDMISEKRNVALTRTGISAVNALLTAGLATVATGALPVSVAALGAGAVAGYLGSKSAGENVRYRTRKYNQIMSEKNDL